MDRAPIQIGAPPPLSPPAGEPFPTFVADPAPWLAIAISAVLAAVLLGGIWFLWRRLLTALASGATVDLEYTVSGTRGRYHFAGLQATTRDHLALHSRRTCTPAEGQLFIVPEVLTLRRLTIRPRRTQIYAGSIPARQGGPGVEFFGVREYKAGDPTAFSMRTQPRATLRRCSSTSSSRSA